MPTFPNDASLDTDAVARWPLRAATHLLGIGLVLTVLIALPVAPTDLDRHQLPKETVLHLTTFLCVLLVRPFRLRLHGRAMTWALTLLVGVTLISSILATNPWLAFRSSALTVSLITVFLMAHYLATTGGGRILMVWCLSAATVGALGGLLQAYGLEFLLFAPTRVPGGTFGNRNFLAHFSALALPLVVLATLTVTKRIGAWAGMVLTGMLIAAILLTRSRAAWLGAATGISVMVLVLYRAKTRGLPILPGRVARVAAALGLGGMLALALPNALSWKSRTPYRETLTGLANAQEGSGRGRVLQYQRSLQLAARHPVLGVGPGNWPIQYAEVAPPSDPSWVQGDNIPLNPWPSSDWIALLSERGPVAFFAVLLFAVALIFHAGRGLARGGEPAMAAAGLLALMVTVAIEGSFDAVLLLAAPGLLVAILVGVLLYRVDATVPDTREVGGKPLRWRLVLLSVMGLIAFRSTQQTTAYVVAGDGRSLRKLSTAAIIDPGSYALRIALGARGSCKDARAAVKLAPLWPAPKAAVRRAC